MNNKLENFIAEYSLNFKEIRSCIVLLQQAIQNDFSETNLKDIDNNLEIIIDKLDRILEDINETEESLFSSQSR